jgi:hypothetical protein
MRIRKHSGEIVDFDHSKLIKSLVSSGADKEVANAVLKEIQPNLYDGISSKKIYRLAFQKLKSKSKVHAARYSLKIGIMALGPAGFHFEKFIARIFKLQGFNVLTNIFVEGNCISHELDVVVEKGSKLAMIECKFHSSQKSKTDVKVPMYILSRFNDVKLETYQLFEKNNQISKCWLATNSKFTSEAIKFAECSGLSLLSWDYPLNNGLKDLVKQFKVYPLTCLTTLTIVEKEILLVQGFLTVYDLVQQNNGFDKLKLSPSRLKNIANECHQLLNT